MADAAMARSSSFGDRRGLVEHLRTIIEGDGTPVLVIGGKGDWQRALPAELRVVLADRAEVLVLAPDRESDLAADLLRAAGIEKTDGDGQTPLRQLEQFVARCSERGRRVVVLLQAVERSTSTQLDELRLLTNLGVGARHQPAWVLTGSARLLARLRARRARALAQRIVETLWLETASDAGAAAPPGQGPHPRHSSRAAAWPYALGGALVLLLATVLLIGQLRVVPLVDDQETVTVSSPTVRPPAPQEEPPAPAASPASAIDAQPSTASTPAAAEAVAVPPVAPAADTLEALLDARLAATASWLRSEPGRTRTIQLMYTGMQSRARPAVARFIQRLATQVDLDSVFVYRLQEGDRELYGVLHGSYPDTRSASREIDGLGDSLRKYGPYVRTVSGVRRELGMPSAPDPD